MRLAEDAGEADEDVTSDSSVFVFGLIVTGTADTRMRSDVER